MPRGYTISAVAHALNVEPKWLDNLLTHNNIPRVDRSRQGIARHIPPETVAIIHVTRQLVGALGCSSAAALLVAHSAIADGHADIGFGVRLTVDLVGINELLGQRLFDAVQAAPPKTRGRPPRRQ